MFVISKLFPDHLQYCALMAPFMPAPLYVQILITLQIWATLGLRGMEQRPRVRNHSNTLSPTLTLTLSPVQ